MTLSGFARALSAHGPELARWPARQSAAALALLAASAEARALLARDAALDDQLRAGLPQPSAEAVARLQASVARAIARRPLPEPPSPMLRLLGELHPAGWGALAVVGVMALWLGLAPPGRGVREALPVLTMLLVPGDTL